MPSVDGVAHFSLVVAEYDVAFSDQPAAVTLRGAGPEAATIEGAGEGSVLIVYAEAGEVRLCPR
jgi:hypothetical protein